MCIQTKQIRFPRYALSYCLCIFYLLILKALAIDLNPFWYKLSFFLSSFFFQFFLSLFALECSGFCWCPIIIPLSERFCLHADRAQLRTRKQNDFHVNGVRMSIWSEAVEGNEFLKTREIIKGQWHLNCILTDSPAQPFSIMVHPWK